MMKMRAVEAVTPPLPMTIHLHHLHQMKMTTTTTIFVVGMVVTAEAVLVAAVAEEEEVVVVVEEATLLLEILPHDGTHLEIVSQLLLSPPLPELPDLRGAPAVQRQNHHQAERKRFVEKDQPQNILLLRTMRTKMMKRRMMILSPMFRLQRSLADVISPRGVLMEEQEQEWFF